jgi:hypothetical protein
MLVGGNVKSVKNKVRTIKWGEGGSCTLVAALRAYKYDYGS